MSPAPSGEPHGPGPRPKLLVDCDPGHDDALALLVAAHHADVVGVTTVAGNAPVELTTRNALVVCELIGLDVPVHAGAARPLVAPPRHGERIHGATGLDGPAFEEPRRRADGHDAAAFIAETVMAHPPGEVWLVPTGPLTNVALALRRVPELAERVAGISFMGGGDRVGNVTATAEFNIWADPEAAAAVLGSAPATTYMSGLDITEQLAVDDAFVDQVRALAAPGASSGARVARFCADLLDFYLDRQQAVSGRRLGPAHDVCAVLAVTHPHLISWEHLPVNVELRGQLTRGMTVVDRRGPQRAERAANVYVGTRIDAPRAFDVLSDAIAAGPLKP